LAEFKIRKVKYYIKDGEGFLSFSSCCFVFSSTVYNRKTKTQKTLICVLFCLGVEALLFASTEEHTLKFFENRMLNNVFEPEGKSSFGRPRG
jgi:hypothetical protein